MPHLESIEYDPLKAVLGRFISRSVLLRRLFYTALGMLFLRQWHVRSELRRIAREHRVHDVLDAGSGYGQYTYLMSKLFPRARILAVDVKEEQIADSRWFMQRVGRQNVTFEIADLTAFRKPDSFDLMLSVDVMEHILEDEAVYENTFASLRSGGLLLITTPNASHPASPSGEIESVIREHVREGYTEEEFRERMARAGFVIQTLKPLYGPLWGRLAWWTLQRIPMRLLSVSKWLAVVVVPWIIVLYLPAAFCMWMDVMRPHARGGGWLLVARKP